MAGMRTLHCAMVIVMRTRLMGGESHSHCTLLQKPCRQPCSYQGKLRLCGHEAHPS